jgi:hypothetical protein
MGRIEYYSSGIGENMKQCWTCKDRRDWIDLIEGWKCKHRNSGKCNYYKPTWIGRLILKLKKIEVTK